MNTFENKTKKNIIIISLLVCAITLMGVGITYAITNYYAVNVSVNTLDMAINYSEITFTNSQLIPTKDSNIDISTKDNVIRAEFNVKGNKEFDVKNVIYDISLTELNVDCELLSSYTKWNLYKNNELVATGSISPSFDMDVLSNKLFLTNKQQKLLDYNTSGDNYILIIWISDPCEKLDSCNNYVDQTNMLNKNIGGKIVVNLYTTKKNINELENRYRTIKNDYKCS